jgi:hypothetical protein
LNQIRAWVHEGRTDAWIAHQLEISASELREFRRRNDLEPGEGGDSSEDLRDEIEAEVEAATRAAEEERARAVEEGDEDEDEDEDEDDSRSDEDEDDGDRPRRRRRRRGGRGRSRRSPAIEGSFDHGEDEGYGLWLDPSVKDNPVYAEHWAGHRPVKVTVEADQIVIRRA